MSKFKQSAIDRINHLAAIGVPPAIAEKIDPPKECGRIEFQNIDTGEPELLIYEQIGLDWFTGEGMTAKAFNDQLGKIKSDSIKVRINSPGGDVFDAIAIYNMLAEHPAKINVTIEGIAASAASIVAMAGDTVSIYESAQVMIHDAWTMVVGNEQDMRQVADLLAKIDGQIADLYAARSGKSSDEFRNLMNSDTYLTGNEAKDLGIVDSVIETKRKESKTTNEQQSTPNASSKKRRIDLSIKKKKLFC